MVTGISSVVIQGNEISLTERLSVKLDGEPTIEELFSDEVAAVLVEGFTGSHGDLIQATDGFFGAHGW